MRHFISIWNRTSPIKRIIIGVVLSLILGVAFPRLSGVGVLRGLFIGSLKVVVPLLVFVLVANTLPQHEKERKANTSTVIGLYLIGTLAVALVAALVNYIFPLKLTLDNIAESDLSAPERVAGVFKNLLLRIVGNPVNAIASTNYIGVLAQAIIFGLAMCNVSQQTKGLLQTMAEVTSQAVRWTINLASFGVLGLMFSTISDNGIGILASYGFLVATLVGTMLFVTPVISPLVAFVMIRQNPYPLVLRCLKESGLTAFLTRSSVTSIPVNVKLCEDLGLNKDTYSVSIPLEATINMAGAVITINVLTLATVNTLGISVDLPTVFLLSVVSAVSACGASDAAGGSLLLIPIARSLSGASSDIAMRVVGVGFIVDVIQDSCETALNSPMNVLFTTVAEKSVWGKNKGAKHN